jgi:uncharacterized caspase-like protein
MLRVLVVLAFTFSTDMACAERRVALVIGDDDYRTVRKLDNAVDDARAVEDVLEQLGFEVTLEVDRDLKRMRRALDDFREDGAGADVALVFFAGHGVEIAGDNRLLPIDADASSLEALKASTLRLEEVRVTIAAVAKVGLIILDACRNDPFGTGDNGGSGRGVVSIASVGEITPGLGRIGRAEGILFAFSAAPGETASDGADGRSPFTAALVKYLGTDGLEIRSTLTLVQQEVYDQTRGKQLPYVESGLPELFFAATSRDELPERERLLLAMADVTPDIRAEVERIGGEHGMPLAPLYGALIGTDAAGLPEGERVAKLTEAAEAFTKVREEITTLSSADPEVAKLRGDAEQQLALGAFDTARVELAEAAEIDSKSRDRLKANYVERTLSEAATRYVSAGAAQADLRYDLAIADLEKVVALFGEAGEKLPPEHADRRLSALLDLGTLYAKVGNIAAAERTFVMVREFAENRVADDPSNPRTRRDLAIAHRQLGNTRVPRGNLAGALEAYREELRLLQEVTAVSAKPQWLRDLAIAYDDVGDVLMAQGDLNGATGAFKASLQVKLALAEAEPDDDALRRDLTIDFDKVGDVLVVMGKPADAIIAYEASLKIRRELAASHPDDAGTQRDLSISHDKIGDALRDRGALGPALASYRAGRAIVEKLAARDPQDTEFTRDIAVSSGKIGNILREQSDLDGALAAYRESLSMTSALAAGDPDNANWQRDLSVNLEKVADMLHKQGDVDGALAGYQQSLAITEKLVAGDPTNADWQRDLSITLAEIGTLRAKQRDYSGAARSFADSLRIRETLAAAEPDNALWQRDLIIALVDSARVAKQPRPLLVRALDIAQNLEDSGRMPEKYDYIIPSLKKMIAQLKASK